MAAQTPTQQFPAWFAFKALLTGAKGVTEVTSQTGLIAAEFQAAPGSWKLFPYTPAGQAAASKWAGVPDTAGGTPGESVAAPEAAAAAVTSVPEFLSRLTSGALWIRVAEVLAGLVLIGIGLNSMLKGRPLSAVTSAAGGVGRLAMF